MSVVDGLQLSVWAPGFPLARTIVCAGRAQLVLGRSSSCDVQLPLALISGRHLELRHRHGVVEVSDLGSTNGTTLDGVRLRPGVFFPMKAGSVLSIEKVRITVVVWSDQADVEAEAFTLQESGAFMRQLVVDAVASERQGDVACVRMMAGSGADRRLEGAGPWRVGGVGAWWPLSGAAVEFGQIEQGAQGVFSWRAGGQGGVRIDGKQVAMGEAVALSHGATIQVGAERGVFYDPLEAYLSKLEGPKEALEVPEARESEQAEMSEAAGAVDDEVQGPDEPETDAIEKQESEGQDLEVGAQDGKAHPRVKGGRLGATEWVILGVIVLLLGSCVWLLLVLFEVI